MLGEKMNNLLIEVRNNEEKILEHLKLNKMKGGVK